MRPIAVGRDLPVAGKPFLQGFLGDFVRHIPSGIISNYLLKYGYLLGIQ
jgi:hypothetical protein